MRRKRCLCSRRLNSFETSLRLQEAKLRMKITTISFILSLLELGHAFADPIFEKGQYPQLDANMKRQERQFYLINARPFGLSLDAHYKDDQARNLIEQFLSQDASDDFEAVTSKHVHEILSSYGEFGDLGFFGGVALAGTAFEYMVKKRDGAESSELATARQRLVRAVQSWHVFYTVTGAQGIVARGIRRLVPQNPQDPPFPGPPPDIEPLFDDQGVAQPRPKSNGSWREDLSEGILPVGQWVWVDSCSKDQMLGQVFGMVVLYDAIKGDPDIDQSLVDQMQQDATLVAKMLMTERDISQLESIGGNPLGTGNYDLIIMDADGRPTKYHDLNPKSVEKIYMPNDSSTFNRFNTVAALGVMKGLYHVSGDPELERYIYEDMLDKREFLDMLSREKGAVDYIYLGKGTNFDDPDMTAIALWLALYTENDPDVRKPLEDFLENGWWAPRDEPTFCASKAKQPLWHLVYLSMTERGTDLDLAAQTARLLLGFSLGPYFNDRVENCDEDEIASQECLAIDGKTVLHLIGKTSSGEWMADEALDPSIRPPSNFNSRSNPFVVNGGGSNLLNPGGDLLAAYWMGRYFQINSMGAASISPNARDHMPLGGRPDGGAPDAGDEDTDLDGCACGQSNHGSLEVFLVLLLFFRRLKKGNIQNA